MRNEGRKDSLNDLKSTGILSVGPLLIFKSPNAKLAHFYENLSQKSEEIGNLKESLIRIYDFEGPDQLVNLVQNSLKDLKSFDTVQISVDPEQEKEPSLKFKKHLDGVLFDEIIAPAVDNYRQMIESKLKTQGSEAREAGLNFNIIKEFNVLKTQITGKFNKI